MKKFFSKYFSLIVSPKKRTDLKKAKDLDKLTDLKKLNYNTLILEKNRLIANDNSKRWLLTGIYGVFYVSIVGLLSATSFAYIRQYIKLLFTSNVNEDKLATAKLATIIISGSSLVLMAALTFALFLFLKVQQNRKELILLYEYEEKRREEEKNES